VLSSGPPGPPRRRRVHRRFLGPRGLERDVDSLGTRQTPDQRDHCTTSAPRGTLTVVRVTEADIARIPAANLRVPRAEFAALWITAEQLCDEQGERGMTDWYAAGVAATCEWLAGAVFRPATGPRQDAASPATGRSARAYEELIEAECTAAERMLARHPQPATTRRRPGWLPGIVATLQWAWHGNSCPPLAVADLGTG
jgi:hypothetical protein